MAEFIMTTTTTTTFKRRIEREAEVHSVANSASGVNHCRLFTLSLSSRATEGGAAEERGATTADSEAEGGGTDFVTGGGADFAIGLYAEPVAVPKEGVGSDDAGGAAIRGGVYGRVVGGEDEGITGRAETGMETGSDAGTDVGLDVAEESGGVEGCGSGCG
jgi:hypothetical protein